MDGPFRISSHSRFRCPRCAEVGLHQRVLGHVKLDECPSCRGVWADHRAIGAIVEDLALYAAVREAFPIRPVPPTLRDRPGPMYVPCPACREIMNRRQFAPGAKVIVDVCRADGVWFDAGELPQVVAFVERHGPELVQAQQAQQARPAPAPVAAAASGAGFTPAASTPYLEVDDGAGSILAEIILGFLR